MTTPRTQTSRPQAPSLQALLHHDACEAVYFSGDANASYERHLEFDHVVTPAAASLRERFEAVVRSLRDLLVRRWLQTVAYLFGADNISTLLLSCLDGSHQPVINLRNGLLRPHSTQLTGLQAHLSWLASRSSSLPIPYTT